MDGFLFAALVLFWLAVFNRQRGVRGHSPPYRGSWADHRREVEQRLDEDRRCREEALRQCQQESAERAFQEHRAHLQRNLEENRRSDSLLLASRLESTRHMTALMREDVRRRSGRHRNHLTPWASETGGTT